MIERIPQFLKDKMTMKSPKIHNYPNEIKDFIKLYGEFYSLNLGSDLKAIFKIMSLGLTSLPICEYKNCNKVIEIINGKVTRGCCRKHRLKITNLEKYGYEHNQSNPNVANKSKETCLKKYGTPHHLSKGSSVRLKIIETNLEIYGVDNVFKNLEIQKKIKTTMMEQYDCEYPMQNQMIKEKFNNTMMNEYGVLWAQQNKDIQLKTVITCIEKFGVSTSLLFPEINERTQKKNLLKFGTIYPSQNIQVKEKTKNTNISKYGHSNVMHNTQVATNHQNNMFSRKEYIWKTGEISKVQGYEPIVLQELEEQGYSFNDVLTDAKDMPLIWYYYKGEKHRYYPDFYIPSENLIIEVKSQWTLDLHREKNELKFQAVKDLGFNFRLEVR